MWVPTKFGKPQAAYLAQKPATPPTLAKHGRLWTKSLKWTSAVACFGLPYPKTSYDAGYAVSTDDGLNWTFYGDTWDDSYLMVHDGAMYRFNIGSFDASQRTLATSTDDGASWTELALDGIPGSSEFFGVYSANGGLHTHHFAGDAPGLYTWNGAGWALTDGTNEAPAEDIQALVYADGAFYGAWAQSGVWTSGEVQMQVGEHTLQAGLYPNPAQAHVRLDTDAELVTITDLRGVAQEILTLGNGELDVSGYPAGIYLLHLDQNGARAAVRLVVQR